MEKLIIEYFLADGAFGIVKLIFSFLVLCAVVYALWWLVLIVAFVWFIIWLVGKIKNASKEPVDEKHEQEKPTMKSAQDSELEDIIFPSDGNQHFYN